MSDTRSGANGPVIVKKYANRRLYNTKTSAYVTLDHLAQMVKDGTEFEVQDARTGEDITRQILTQIIVEEEAKGQNLLPIQFLRQLIHFYGDQLQGLVPGYLEMSMDSFTKNQGAMREKYADAFSGRMGFKEFEQLTRQNMAMFDNAMKMVSPFTQPENETPPVRRAPEPEPRRANGAREDDSNRDEEIRTLKDQLAAMQRAISDLAQTRK